MTIDTGFKIEMKLCFQTNEEIYYWTSFVIVREGMDQESLEVEWVVDERLLKVKYYETI